VAFDYLIANNDAHGKNVSLLRDPADGVRLASLYDLSFGDVERWLRLLMDRKARAVAAGLEAQGWTRRIPRRVRAFVDQRAQRLGAAFTNLVAPPPVR
jgi:hypothetical protein